MTQADAMPRTGEVPTDAAAVLAGRVVLATALAAATCGAWLGLGRPAPHPPVESAQVLTGLVSYPADAPFRDYHLRPWTAINQISALALRAGIAETDLNLAWSAASGSLLVAAVVLVMLAAGGRPWPALFVAPLAVLATTMLDDATLCYRIVLWGTMGTYGAIALPYCVVGQALVACGCRRTGLVWLGLAPAIHVGVGTVTLAATVSGLAWERRIRGPGHVPWRWLAIGLLVSATSWAVHRALFVEPSPPITPEEADLWRLLIARIDTHRIEVPWEILAPSLFVLGGIGAVAVASLRRTSGEQASSPVLYTTLAILAAIGAVGGLLTHVQPQLPMAVIQAMPGRYANAAYLIAVPFAWGLGVRRADRVLPVAMLTIVVAHFALDRGALIPPAPNGIRWFETALVAIAAWWSGRGPRADVPAVSHRERLAARGLLGLTCLCGAGLLATGPDPVAVPVLLAMAGLLAAADLPRILPPPAIGGATSKRGIVLGTTLVVASIVLAFGPIRRIWTASRPRLADYRSDPFWRRVHDEATTILPPWNVRVVQLRAGVPVTIDDSLVNGSGFAYSPAGVGRIVELVRAAYGIDLLAPGFELRRQDGYEWANRIVPAIWRSRTTADWQEAAAACGFREVLSTGDCPLELPLVTENGEFALYRVPHPGTPSHPNP